MDAISVSQAIYQVYQNGLDQILISVSALQ